MTAKPITPTLSVSEQVLPQEVAALAAAGFKSIVCNRPDGEGADQPSFAEIEAAATAAGLPVVDQACVLSRRTKIWSCCEMRCKPPAAHRKRYVGLARAAGLQRL